MIEKEVISLIYKIREEINPEKEIYIGSSKGGYSALYFGLERKNSYIITGAPQYNLGDYLSIPNHKSILKYIMGYSCNDSIVKLNNLMKDKINLNRYNNNSIYIHYSTEEETYKSDIKPLLEELDKLDMKIYRDEKAYKSHSELTIFFPDYIKDTLKLILGY